jgi:hypothetical protein
MPSISRLAIDDPSVRCAAAPAVRIDDQNTLASGAMTIASTAMAMTSSMIVNPSSDLFSPAARPGSCVDLISSRIGEILERQKKLVTELRQEAGATTCEPR